VIAYGINNKFRYNYKDYHPKKWGKGCCNWWEVELGGINKGSARQKAKIDIKKELEMAKKIKDDCNCGKPLKINDPKRKIVRKVPKKK